MNLPAGQWLTPRDGHRVYVSLLKSQNLHGDAVALLDWAWKTTRW